MTRRLTIDDATGFSLFTADPGMVHVIRNSTSQWLAIWDRQRVIPPLVWGDPPDDDIEEFGPCSTPQAALDAAIAAGAVIEGDET